MTERDIPVDHHVFDEGEIIPISKIIGIPMLLSKVRPSLAYAATRDTFGYGLSSGHYPNRLAEKLMVCCDPRLAKEDPQNAKLFETRARWLSNVGNIIVAREDRKPLYAHHLEILIEFLESVRDWPWMDSDSTFFDLSDWARRSFDPWSPPPAEERLVLLTPNDFKDLYLEKRYQWATETEEPDNLGKLPTPWSWTREPSRPYAAQSRKLREKKYRDMNHLQRFDKAENWKERLLLKEIHMLKCRLGEAQGDVASGGSIIDVPMSRRLLVDLKGKITLKWH